jgi:hypothetical protein
MQERAAYLASYRPIAVPERLAKPHHVIARWLVEHEQGRPTQSSDRNTFGPAFTEWTATDDRKHRILDTLFKAVEHHGISVEAGGVQGETYFAFDRERIDYKLHEKSKQVRRPKTEAEMRWTFQGDKIWKQVLEPTGVLVFTIETYVGSPVITRKWLDWEAKPLEQQLSDIVRSLVLVGVAAVKARERQHAAQRRRVEEEQLREIAAARRVTERNQWRRLVELSRAWEDVERARRFVSALQHEQHDPEQVIGDRPLRDWLVWASNRLQRENPMASATAGPFESIAAVPSSTYRD